MGQGKLTNKEKAILCKSPYIKAINNERIQYTKAFKVHFMREYLDGKGPTQIFCEAGFDTDLLGAKRIERAAAHWRAAYNAGRLFLDSQEETQKNNYVMQLEALKIENKLLKERIKQLSKLQGVQDN